MGGNASLIRANALAIPLRDESVDLIVTSPPYFALRSYQDGGEHYDGQIGSEATPAAFLAALWAVTDECWRVLKPTGSLWVNLGDKYAGSGGNNNAGVGGSKRGPNRYNQTADVRPKSKMLLPHRYALGCADPGYRQWSERSDTTGPQWVLRSDVVWSKPNGLPESVTDRVRASHEYWFHLTKEGTYYADLDAVREQSAPPSSTALRGPTKGFKSNGDRNDLGMGNFLPNPLGKLPGSVWTIPTEPLTVPDWLDVDHYAAFPTELPRRIILGWSPPNGIVLDPFSGTGTTAMIARALGRYGIGIDLSADYLRLARWRVFDSGHWDKAVSRTTGRPCQTPDVLPGQLSLLGGS